MCVLRLVASALLLMVSVAGAEPSPIAPWEEGYAHNDEVLLRRLDYVFEGLRRTARAEPNLKDLLDQVRLHAPIESLVASNPNAWAIPSAQKQFILVESRFVNQIAALSAAGAYLTIGEDEAGIKQICSQITQIEREAKARGATPVVLVKLEGFPEFKHPPTRRALEKLSGLIADEAMVWFFLHEVGHHALGHKPIESATKSELERNVASRTREAQADRWASQTMIRLGLGLFGVDRYLVGRATIEFCLQEIGYTLDESASTHPSWHTRTITMRREFDVRKTGRGYPRAIFIPAEPHDMWVHVAAPGDDAATYLTERGRPQRAASEWHGQSVTVYARTQKGGRVELNISDASLGIMKIVLTEFDATNKWAGNSPPLFSIQFNPRFLDWIEVVPGVHVGDLREQNEQDGFRSDLRAVGAPEAVINEVLAANRTYRASEAAIVIAFMKGQVAASQLAARFAPVSAEYESRLVALLGVDGYDRLRKRIDGNPLSKWAPGKDGEYYRKLEDAMLRRNFERQK